MFGLGKQGFKRKQYSDIINDLENNAKGLFGENVNLAPSSPLGMILKLYAWSVNILWQLAEKVYFSGFISTAEGVSLDRIAKYIGIKRNPAKFAEGLIRFVGDENTNIPEGTLVRTESGIQYTTLQNATIGGSLFVDVESRATNIGAASSVSENELTVLVNPISGVDEVTNVLPIFGADAESDADFRLRYERSVAKSGSSTSASIEATLLQIEDVTDVRVRENDTMEEVDGIPPKSIAPIVAGGDDEDIARAILETKSAGIRSFGEVLLSINDSRGIEYFIGFSRPSVIDVVIEIALITDDRFPEDGEEIIEKAIEDYISSLSIGDNVIFTKLISLCHIVTGVLDVSPTINSEVTTLVINEDELAKLSLVVFT